LNGAGELRPHLVLADEVIDKFALRQLVETYCHAVDRRDFPMLRDLYWDDAIDDHGGMFCGGPDALVAWLRTMLGMWATTAHYVHNALFLVDGNAAEGEIAVTAYHCTVDGRSEVIAHGRYLDAYRKEGGIWRFARRALVLDWSEERAAAPRPAPDAVAAGVVMGRADDGDAVYQRLERFAAQRQHLQKTR